MSRIAGLLSTLLFTLILAGCNTLTVDISVPDVITQHEPFTYEAEADPDAVGQIAYEWSLDGSIISSLPIDNALIATAGEHTLSVKITDEEGETGEAEVTLEVLPAEVLNADFAVNVELLDLEESPLESVTVTIDGVTVESDALGIAAFTGLTQTPVLTVTANKEGYIPQSYRFDLASAQESADIQLTLMARANPVVFNNDTEVTVENSDLNTSVTLPAGAFVDANGDPVTGEITATITPVDTREMGASYLGGGVALTEESEVVQLLSLGMIDFEFTQNGEAVQLAAEASAQIEMDLVAETGPDGRVYTIGEEIEMWWFDEATGLWVEEGVGEIVASASSPTGMRLIATVKHFTTWNWDYYKQEDRASFFLTCTKNGQQLTASESCLVTAKTNGYSRSYSLGYEGITAINLPPDLNLTISARVFSDDGDLYLGSKSFTTRTQGNDVVVNTTLDGTLTGEISCFLKDGLKIVRSGCAAIVVLDIRSGNQYAVPTSPGTTTTKVPFVKGTPFTLVVSNQGEVSNEYFDGNSEFSRTFIRNTAIGELACYATVDGVRGEYYPCDAVVIQSEGSHVGAIDFKSDPMMAYFSYDQSSSSVDMYVATPFNGGSVSSYLTARDGFRNPTTFDSSEGQRFLLSTVEPVSLVVQNSVSSSDLYEYRCLENGQPFEPCIIRYENGATGETTRGGMNGPSWMENKIWIPNVQELNYGRFSIDGDFYLIESISEDASTGILTINVYQEAPK